MKNLICLFVFTLSMFATAANARADACTDADTAIATAQQAKSDSDGARADAANAKTYAAGVKVDAQAAWDDVKDHECVTPAFTAQINGLFSDYSASVGLGNTYQSGSDSAHVSGVLALADAITWRGIDCPTSKIFADGAAGFLGDAETRADNANENYGDAANAMQQVLDDIDAYDFDCEGEGEGE